MIGNFGKMKDLYALKKQADAMKKQMEQIKVSVVEGEFEIIMKGGQRKW